MKPGNIAEDLGSSTVLNGMDPNAEVVVRTSSLTKNAKVTVMEGVQLQ